MLLQEYFYLLIDSDKISHTITVFLCQKKGRMWEEIEEQQLWRGLVVR
jgi:hypothetical protein